MNRYPQILNAYPMKDPSPLVTLASALADPPPWWQPHLEIARGVVAQGASGQVVDALNAVRTPEVPVRFVDQSRLPAEEPYEAFIAREGGVPTRDNLHDLLNGVIWLGYPLTKRRLNRLQAEQIRVRGKSGPRGALRDALTLFDENGAVLHATPSLIQALRERDWTKLFVDLRTHWQSAQLMLFGHALLEKLMQPRKPITAHVWVVDATDDAAIAASVAADTWSSKPFLPLPVLGVPGWWQANECASFYADDAVFRRAR